MPTYEYLCRACSHAFERFQRISDSPVRTCPSCGERRVERLISAGAGILFKGSGFYATDYRKADPKREGAGGDARGGEQKDSGTEKAGGSEKAAGGEKSGKGDVKAGGSRKETST